MSTEDIPALPSYLRTETAAHPANVPTLTEVMPLDDGETADLAHQAVACASPVAGDIGAQPDAPLDALEAATQSLLACLGPQLEQQIAETIGRVLHEQMLGFNARVRKAVAEVVRENVARAALHGMTDAASPDVGPAADGAGDGGNASPGITLPAAFAAAPATQDERQA